MTVRTLVASAFGLFIVAGLYYHNIQDLSTHNKVVDQGANQQILVEDKAPDNSASQAAVRSSNDKKPNKGDTLLSIQYSLNSLLVKFALREPCQVEISKLTLLDLPDEIHDLISEIGHMCSQNASNNLVQSKLLSKVLSIYKIADVKSNRELLISKITKLQYYFYSKYLNNKQN